MRPGLIGTLPREDLERAIRGLEHKLSTLGELASKFQRQRDKAHKATARYVAALQRIKDMAERSDAHPDLRFAEIAREALECQHDWNKRGFCRICNKPRTAVQGADTAQEDQ